LIKGRFPFQTMKHGPVESDYLLTSGGPNQTIEVGHAGRSNSLRAMQIGGVPCVLGMNGNVVQWQFIGLHPKPGHLHSILKTWRDKK
jgi:hypothetical protein